MVPKVVGRSNTQVAIRVLGQRPRLFPSRPTKFSLVGSWKVPRKGKTRIEEKRKQKPKVNKSKYDVAAQP